MKNTNAKKHGHTGRIKKNDRWKVIKSPTYLSWEAMNARCYNTKHKWYGIYGGRGIEVCEQWRRGTYRAFANFLADMGERPAKHMTLDRKDGNLGYYKDNCWWADKSTQRINQRGMPAPILDVEPINSVPF